MMPGPDEIIACPHCQGLASRMTLMSYTTFGGTVWSDGISSGQPNVVPEVVRCRHCRKFYWMADAPVLGEVGPFAANECEPPLEWYEAERVERLSEAGYFEALNSGLARDRKQERDLRILAWRRGNDSYRWRPVSEWGSPSAEAIANLVSLVPLFGRSAHDQTVKGEVLRQLCRFKEARAVLEKVNHRHFKRFTEQLILRCKRNDGMLCELNLRR